MWTIQSWYEAARADAASRPEIIRGYGEHYLRACEAELPGVPRAEIARQLAAYNRKRLDAQPPLAKFPELRGLRELIEAEWRGYRDGANLSREHLDGYVGGWPFFVREVAAGRFDRGRNECSMVFFPDSDRGPIAAKNWDVGAADYPEPPYWPMLNEHVIMDGVSCNYPCDEQSPELFPAPMEKLVGRYCRTTRETVEMLERYNDFWGPGNRMVIDRDKSVAVIEKTTRKMKTRYSPDGYAFVTGMVQEDPELVAHGERCRAESLKQRGLKAPCADTAYWAAQPPRHKLMKELLEEAKANPTVDTMRALLQHRSERGKVAGNGDRYMEGGPEAEHTARTQIWLLREGRAKWWARDHARNIPSWENPREDVVYKGVWVWD